MLLEKKIMTGMSAYLSNMFESSIHGTGQNVTMDKWFTSGPLAKEMVSRYSITIVGTHSKNKPELPHSFQPSRGKEVGSSQFAFDKETLLVTHCPKMGKSVLLLSTMHSGKDINEETGKSEVIHFYNETKGGVNVFDQMAHSYTVSRKNKKVATSIFLWNFGSS